MAAGAVAAATLPAGVTGEAGEAGVTGVTRQGGAGTLTLGLANALALAAALLAATFYARWMDAPAFAHWALALGTARAGLLVLDGGLKAALVRRARLPERPTMQRLGWLCAALSAAMVGLLGGAVALALHFQGIGWDAALLLFLYPAAYWLAYPPLLTALASLERAQRFDAVGRAEGASVAVEFALPALLMMAGAGYAAAFAAAVVVARGLRTAWLVHCARRLARAAATMSGHTQTRTLAPAQLPQPATDAAAAGSAGQLLKEGSGLQAAAALSMLRDQMHLWLLAPWFGALWVGFYSFAIIATGVVSQVFVQTVARTLVPRLQTAAPAQRPDIALHTLRRLAVVVLPLMALLTAAVAAMDQAWWQGRWAPAVALLPWIALRMLAGLATTVLGGWLVVAASPWATAAAHARWTAAEVVLGVAALAWFGPLGLAIAGAASAWFGVAVFIAGLTARADRRALGARVARELLQRPSLWVAVGTALLLHRWPAAWPAIPLALAFGWLAEPGVRAALRALLAQQRWLRGYVP